MAFKKRNQPGYPCCTPPIPPPCTTDFHVDECLGVSAGATVVVKTASGTTVASGTTNSSGDVSLNLAGYVGQTLYATVTHNTTYFDIATGVLLGNFCGRRYSYRLNPKSVTYSGTCGQLVIQTRRCDGTTANASKSFIVVKWNGGTYGPYSTGTTDASGNATLTGLTYGGANDIYRVTVTDAVGGIVTSDITLTTANCSATVLFRMAVSSGSPCATPQFTITYNSGGGGQTCPRGCCQTACPGITMAPFFQLSDPTMNIARTCDDTGVGTFAVTPVAGTALLGCPFDSCAWNVLSSVPSNGQQPQTGYRLDLSSGSPVLTVLSSYNCANSACIGQWWFTYCNGITCCGVMVSPCPPFGYCKIAYITNTIAATTWTCNPFSATFSMPSILMQKDYGTNYPFVGAPRYFATVPSRTITITE